MIEILSYREVDKGNERKEFLKDHIKSALDKIGDLDDSRIYKIAKKVDPEVDFKNIVRLAIIFHDSGKAFMRFDRGKYTSFRGHEFVSAIIMDKFVREMYLDQYYVACTFAVLYHHHAMNFDSRKSIDINKAKYRNDFEDFTYELKLVLNEFLNEDEKNSLNKVFDKINILLDYGYLNTIETEIFKRVSGKNRNKVRKISYLTLNTLIAADYLSAESRNDGKTNFYYSIKEFYDLYLRPMDNNI